MDYYKGTLEDLQTKVSNAGITGEWKNNGEKNHQFKDNDGGIINWFPSTGKVQYQGNGKAKEILKQKMKEQEGVLIDRETPQKKKIFVVHGHDTTSVEQIELILHKLGLDPFVLMNSSGDGLTIIEALEKYINPGKDSCSFGIVILTPDDMGYSKRDGKEKEEPRARQNVVLEMGMLISALGRNNVAILKKGYIETPSDAHGIIYIAYNDHIKETVPKLVGRLNGAGFTLTPEDIAKASS